MVNLVILVNHKIRDLVKREMKDLADKGANFIFLNLEGQTVHKFVLLLEHYSTAQKL